MGTFNKIKNATKKISAVGATALIVSSAGFAAGLSNYPNNFVENSKFNGQVVIGSDAQAIDSVSAMSIIDDLKKELSGEEQKVRLTYKKLGEGKDSISAVDSKETLNFGETLASVADDLDKDVSNLLRDSRVDNNDYNQELTVLNGEFSYRIFDEVDDEKIAKDGLYYAAGTSFMKYTLDFEDELDISSSSKREDLIGEEMLIMGNEFTIVSIADDELTLIGGSNKVSLGEGETTKIIVDGKSYDVSIQSVSDTKVLLTVNGQSKSIERYKTEKLAGISIAVTDLVSSSRDAVKGYAEVVIGGQKVELTSSRVKINGDELDDIYDDYEVDVNFLGSDTDVFEGFEITYKVDDNVVLGKGDSLKDVLFNSFELRYDGLNKVEYSEFKITSDNDEVKFSGTLFDGKELPTEFKLTTDDVVGSDLYLGSTTNRIYFKDSDLTITDLISADRMDAIRFLNSTGGTTGTKTSVAFNISAATSDVKDNMVWSREDDDEFYLYKIKSVDKDDLEIDFENIITGKSTNAVDIDDVQSVLEWAGNVATNNSDELIITIGNLGDSILYLENELQMDFSNVEQASFNATSGFVNLTFSYNPDVDMDDNSNEADSFMIGIARANDVDDAIELKILDSNSDFVSDDDLKEDSDYRVYVDHYGTMVIVDEDNYDDITIKVPNKEVQGLVGVVFGEGGSEVMSKVVDATSLEDAKDELESEGYIIVSQENIDQVEAEFDITAPLLDTEVENVENLIVVGGPAVNRIAAQLLDMQYPTYGADSGVSLNEAVVRYFEDSNSVLIYGYEGKDTAVAAKKITTEGLSGNEVFLRN